MPKTDTLPVQIEFSEAQYLVLLKQAPKRSRVLRASSRPWNTTGSAEGLLRLHRFPTDGLGLRALALVHAPEALPAIERGLKRARENSGVTPFPLRNSVLQSSHIFLNDSGARRGTRDWSPEDARWIRLGLTIIRGLAS